LNLEKRELGRYYRQTINLKRRRNICAPIHCFKTL